MDCLLAAVCCWYDWYAVFPDGRITSLLQLHGTIPTYYKVNHIISVVIAL
jgi:hypothetical protein